MAVAIWDHRPSAEELLRARVDDGWRPTATATREGDVILGYAARLGDAPEGSRANDDEPKDPSER